MSERDDAQPSEDQPSDELPGDDLPGGLGDLGEAGTGDLDEAGTGDLDEAGSGDLDETDLDASGLDDVDVRDLLRGALRPPPGSVAPELLGGVQRRLRVRSQGKFYGDGWSTASAPRSTYLVTSALMLVLILVVAILLVPWEAVGL